MKLLFGLIGAWYLILVFPFAYFRHDDWLILGNAVLNLKQNWAFAFSPTLYFNDIEVIWFFRPLFKIFVYLFFILLGYQYYFWLFGLFALTVCSSWLGYQIVSDLTQSKRLGLLFALLFLASMHFHFGSTVWMGEGMMNCPQVFFLILSAYLFIRATGKERFSFLWGSGALASYILSLGFKESSVFHVAFLFAILVSENRFKLISVKKKAFWLLPYFAVTAIYLWIRFLYMPLNPHYTTNFSWMAFGRTVFFFVGALSLPVAVLLIGLRLKGRDLLYRYLVGGRKKWLYLAFILLSVSPYLVFGHGFFSPGWLFFPGFYLALVACLMGEGIASDLSTPFVRRLGFALFYTSVFPILIGLYQVGWWKWHQGQRQIKQIIASAPKDKTSEVVIVNCANGEFPDSRLQRVVGFEASLYQLWALHHEERVPISIIPCTEKYKVAEDKLILKWRFPKFTRLASG